MNYDKLTQEAEANIFLGMHLEAWETLENLPAGEPVLSERPAADASRSQSLVAELSRLAREDPSALVRLALASALQRLPVAQRAGVAAPLVAHAEDAHDHNLPLMIWYGIIPLADHDPSALVKLAAGCKLSVTRRFIARRLAEDIEKNPAPLNELK